MKEGQQKRLLSCRFEGTVIQTSARVIAGKVYLNERSVKQDQSGLTRFAFEFLPLESVQIQYQQVSANSQVEYRMGLANLLFIGTQRIGGSAGRHRGRIDLRLAGQDIALDSLEWYGSLGNRLADSRGIEVTSHLVTADLMSNRDRVKQKCDDLCVLLSFATCNWVAPLYEDIFLNGQKVSSTLLPGKTFPYNPGELVIDAREGKELKEYLEATYPNYVRLKNVLSMNIVTEYFVHSRLSGLLEAKYLMAAVGMERLRSRLSDYFKAKGKVLCRGSLRSDLREFYHDISMPYRPSELCFVDVRNKLVHTGGFPPDVDCVEEHQKLLNLCDRTILTTLGYRGKPYLNSAKGYDKELVP